MRTNLSSKSTADKPVIGKQRGNNFRKVFGAAQDQLRAKFGMEMMELPGKEKVTIKEKRGRSYSYYTNPPTDYLQLR